MSNTVEYDGDSLAAFLRRYDRRDFFKVTGSALLVSLLAGCAGSSNHGSGGGPSGGNTVVVHTVQGSVQLPSGYSLPLSGLTVISGAGSASVASNGSFTVNVFGTTPSLITLTDSSGNALLLGYAPVDGTAAEISTTQTAIALTHYALGGYMLPLAVQPAFRTLIAHDASMTALTAAVEAQVVADTAALTQGGPALLAAVQTAVEALVPTGTLSGIAGGSARPAIKTIPQTGHDTSSTTQILVNPAPTTQQSGITVGPNTAGAGLVVTNYDRRNLEVFITRTGYRDSSGTDQTVSAMDPANALITNSYLGSVNGLNGVFGSVIDALNGNVAYAPSASTPYSLPLNPADAQRTTYRVDVVGNGHNNGAPATVAETAAQTHMAEVTLAKEIILPLLASLLNVNYNVVEQLKATNVLTAYDDLVGILQFVISTGVNITTSTINAAAVSVLTGLANNTTFRQNIINYFTAYLLPPNSLPFVVAKSLATGASGIVSIIDKFLNLADVTRVVYDWNNDNNFETWTATVSLPAVHLNPATGTVNAIGNTVAFTLTTATQGSLTYEWITTGTYGHLTDTNGHSGTDFTSTLNAASYVCDSLPSGSQSETDTVTCIVSLIPDSGNPQNRVPVGNGSSTVTVAKTTVTGTLPVTTTTENGYDTIDGIENYYTAGYYVFPIVAGVTTYIINQESFGNSSTLFIDAADIGAPIPADQPLPTAVQIPASGTEGGVAESGFGLYRRGDQIYYFFDGAETYPSSFNATYTIADFIASEAGPMALILQNSTLTVTTQ
jgi:hypothetical protein